MLVAGRLVQGLGGGGIGLMTNMIVSDLVAERERGKFSSIVFITFSLGMALGPIVGGVLVQHASWRWVFYLNLPVAGLCLVMLYFFLQVNTGTSQLPVGIWKKLAYIDWLGNILLIMSVTSILIALSSGGDRYAWSSWHVLVPLLAGFAGTALFHCYESSRFCLEPTLPPRVFVSNRTTTITLFISFIQYLLTYWVIFFIPTYLQGALLESPSKSGVLLLPTVLFGVPVAMVSGNILSKTGRYKPLHVTSLTLLTLGLSLFITLDLNSTMAKLIIFQLIAAAGIGFLMSTLLPAVHVGLVEADVGVATASWGFLRSYGGIWGVAIPSAILNSQFQSQLVRRISDQEVLAILGGGAAYSEASGEYIKSLSPDVRREVVDIYVHSLRVIWIVATVISGCSFTVTFLEKEIPLRMTVKSDYGLKEKETVSEIEA